MAKLNQGLKYEFKSGWLEAVNIQVGTVDIVVSGSNGTTAVVFPKAMRHGEPAPTIILKSTEALADDGILSVSSPTPEGFTAELQVTGDTTYTINWLAIQNKWPSRRGGFKSGYVKARNIQSGTFQLITAGGSGDGTAQTVTFKAPFKNIPIVLLTTQESVTTGKINISTVPTRGNFEVDVTGSSVVGGDILVGWIAIDIDEPWTAAGNTAADSLPDTGDNKDFRTRYRSGFRGGYVYPMNIQSGHNTIATDGSGDGTAEAIAFRRRLGRSAYLQRTPIVFAEPQEADATGNVLITAQADTGFTLDVTDSAVTTGNLTVGWIAFGTKALLKD